MQIPARRILVVEDEGYTRSTTAELLRQYGFEVAEAANAVSAKRAVKAFDPDAMVIDIELGDGPNGLDLIAALNKTHKDIAFVLLSNFAPTRTDMAELRNVAYLSKKHISGVGELIDALESVLHDQDPKYNFPAVTAEALDALTPNQLQTLKLLAQGATNLEIAEKRGVSLRATEKSIERIYSTLGLRRDGKSSPRLIAAQVYLDSAGRPNAESIGK